MNRLIYIALALLLIPTQGFARDDYRSKLGFEIKGLKTNRHPTPGWLAGINWARFIGKSDAHAGLSGYYGTPTGNDPKLESIWFVGGTVGYDGKFSRTDVFELKLLVGYGQAKLDGTEATSYFTVEPSLGYGFALGKGYRLLITASYIHQNRANQFSGLTFGFRFDRKTETTVKHVEP